LAHSRGRRAAFTRLRHGEGRPGPERAKSDAGTLIVRQLAIAGKSGAGRPRAGGRLSADWMSASRTALVIVRRIAGNPRASGLDRSQYHRPIESDAKLVRGVPSIAPDDCSGIDFRPSGASFRLQRRRKRGVFVPPGAGAVESLFKRRNAPRTAGCRRPCRRFPPENANATTCLRHRRPCSRMSKSRRIWASGRRANGTSLAP
jgi:hypothetical protein